MAKRVPKGQLNKNKVVFKRLNNLMKDLGKKYSIRVGIMGEDANKKHPDSNLTMAELGTIHEFGTTITIEDAVVVIPTRSFLRMPLLSPEGKKFLNKAVNNELSDDREINKIVGSYDDGKLLRDVAELLGVTALQRVQDAFQTSGFGNWADTQEPHKVLYDTGTLKKSISFKVEEIK